jgi:putative hydrolase
MTFLLDLHNHTQASGHATDHYKKHIARAKKAGLQLVGISEHGPLMPGSCGLSYFEEMLNLPSIIEGMPWLKGVEANIMDFNGTLDLPDSLLKKLDYTIASIHTGLLTPRGASENTQAIIKVMENPHVNIIGHLGDPKVPIRFTEIVRAAKRTNTLIEINNSSLKPGTRRYDGGELIRILLKECKHQNVCVIAGSDSHKARNVGKLERAKRLIEESGISEELVVNTDLLLLKRILAKKTKNL